MSKKKQNMATRRAEHARVAEVHEAVHAAFFNREPINLREVRERLDPVLKAQAVREILKVDVSDSGDDDDPVNH